MPSLKNVQGRLSADLLFSTCTDRPNHLMSVSVKFSVSSLVCFQMGPNAMRTASTAPL